MVEKKNRPNVNAATTQSLKTFAQKHPDAENALDKWYNDTKSADRKNFSEIKKTFNAAESVGNDRYIFDIKGNRYRLIDPIYLQQSLQSWLLKLE